MMTSSRWLVLAARRDRTTVQERAKRLDIHEETTEGLRAIIEDEVERWNEDFKRGLRAVPVADPETVVERAFRNLAGYGPLTAAPRRRRRLGDHDQRARRDLREAPPRPERLPRRGLPRRRPRRSGRSPRSSTTRAGAHRKLDPAEGLQDAQLDDGARLHIVHGDVGRGGHVMVNIRKFTGVAFRTLDELVERDMLDRAVAAFLRAVRAGRALDRVRRRARLGQDDAAVVLPRRARPDAAGRRSPRRCSRPTSRCPNVAQHADPARPRRPAGGRPAAARGGLPAHGARRRHRRRGPRPRGAAAAAHAVVGRQGLHDDPRRLGPPGAHPAALHLPARRQRERAADVGAQHARQRGDRRRRALGTRRATAFG